jgi:hypothetical protein
VDCFGKYSHFKYKHYNMYIYMNMFAKVGLLEETREGWKEENDREWIMFKYMICVGTRHNKIHWKLLSNTGWG